MNYPICVFRHLPLKGFQLSQENLINRFINMLGTGKGSEELSKIATVHPFQIQVPFILPQAGPVTITPGNGITMSIKYLYHISSLLKKHFQCKLSQALLWKHLQVHRPPPHQSVAEAK